MELGGFIANLADGTDAWTGLLVDDAGGGTREGEGCGKVLLTDDTECRPPDREVGIASTRSPDGTGLLEGEEEDEEDCQE